MIDLGWKMRTDADENAHINQTAHHYTIPGIGILTATRSNKNPHPGQYFFSDCRPLTKQRLAATSRSLSAYDRLLLAHRSLCHLPISQIKLMYEKGILPDLDLRKNDFEQIQEIQCPACIEGGMRNISLKNYHNKKKHGYTTKSTSSPTAAGAAENAIPEEAGIEPHLNPIPSTSPDTGPGEPYRNTHNSLDTGPSEPYRNTYNSLDTGPSEPYRNTTAAAEPDAAAPDWLRDHLAPNQGEPQPEKLSALFQAIDEAEAIGSLTTARPIRRPQPGDHPLKYTTLDALGPTRIQGANGERYAFLLQTLENTGGSYGISIPTRSRTCTELLPSFKKAIQEIETSTGGKIEYITSDGAPEFLSHEFASLLHNSGIQHIVIPPHTPQLNGHAETWVRIRKLDIARTLQDARHAVDTSTVPYETAVTLWPDALQYSTHIRNHTIQKDGTNANYRMYGEYGRIPHPAVFASSGFGFRPKAQRTDLFTRSEPAAILYYQADRKSWRCYGRRSKSYFYSSKVTTYDEALEEDERARSLDYQQAINTLVNNIKENRHHLQPDEGESINDPIIATFVDNRLAMSANANGTYEPADDSELPNILPGERITAIVSAHLWDIKRQNIEERMAATLAKEQQEEILEEEDDETMTALLAQLNKDIQSKATNLPETPKSLATALGDRRYSHFWRHAAVREYSTITDNQTWEVVDRNRSTQRNIMRSIWTFKIVTDKAEGTTIPRIVKFKARLVADGSSQKFGIDYLFSFAPVIKYESIRILLAIAAKEEYHLHQFDAVGAYLNAPVEEDIYMELPPTVNNIPHAIERKSHVVKLKKSLYGMKQSGRNWYQAIHSQLDFMEFKRNRAEPCVYTHKSRRLILGIYVDDIILLYKTVEDRDWFHTTLTSKYEVEDRGPIKFLLGMEIDQAEDFSVKIRMTKYISQLLEKYGMQDCKGASTPLADNRPLTTNTENNKEWQAKTPYKELAGAILFIMVTCRPTLAYGIGICCRYMANYNSTHWIALKHLLRYLKEKIDTPLVIKTGGHNSITTFADSSFADCEDRKSTGGYIVFYGDAPVLWKSKKLGTVATSTTTAEYVQLADAAKATIWLVNLLKECGQWKGEVPIIYEDNQACLNLAQKMTSGDRTKHIELRHHYIRELIDRKQVKVLYCRTELQLADYFTKQQGKALSQNMQLSLMGITPFQSPTREKLVRLANYS